MRFLFLSTSFFYACASSEEGVKIYNSDPMATITSHAEGVELLEAIEYTFVGQVSDDNHAMTDLQVTWSSDSRESDATLWCLLPESTKLLEYLPHFSSPPLKGFARTKPQHSP